MSQAHRHVCVGLDSELIRLPRAVSSNRNPQLAFNCAIVDATADFAAAYKPNSAFYEALGPDGISTLVSTVKYIRKTVPDTPVILDAKRGDIGSTNLGYAHFAFEQVRAHAMTVQPYLGSESASEFRSYADRGILVLCRTSNPGAPELQDLLVHWEGTDMPLYEAVAIAVRERWNTSQNCGLVVGATYPRELARIRALAPDLPLLIPGVGAQGADLEETLSAAVISGKLVGVINSSRGIIFAQSDQHFAEGARRAGLSLDNRIRNFMSNDASRTKLPS